MRLIGRLLFLLILLVTTSAFAQTRNCESPSIKKYTEMDYKAFDQSPPDGGWRALTNNERNLEAADLIDSYLVCRPRLTSEQKATLVFHSGQIHANLGHDAKAIKRFGQAYNKNLDTKYHWNSFVDGTIAFIKKDFEKLKAARDKIKGTEKDHPYVETLNILIQCFDKPYKERGPNCAKKSTPPTSSPKGAVN